jgi:hypothetical protein
MGRPCQEFDQKIDRFPSDLGLISLNVDKQIHLGAGQSDLGNSVCTAWSLRVGHHPIGPNLLSDLGQLWVVDGQSYPNCQSALLSGVVGVGDQGFAGLGKQQFFSESG